MMFFADRIKTVTVHSTTDRDGKMTAFVEIDGTSMLGKNPDVFRQLALRCSEAAALLAAHEDQASGGAWEEPAVRS